MANITIIGLGNMGLPMANNLNKAGHDVTAYDATSSAITAAQSSGLTTAETASGACEGANVVILMLPNGDIVKSVTSDILPSMPKGALLIDCSTIDVDTARAVHDMASHAGMLSLDAPVSGGVGGAEGGTLTFMVGGSEESLKAGQFAFDIMGQKAVHCGDGGAGQAAKICNNMLLGISMIGSCEAFSLAKKLGLSQAALFDVVSTSSGSCWSVNTYCPVPEVGPTTPADNDYTAGFAAALMLKDLKLSQEAAQSAGANTPLGEHATNLYQEMNDVEKGHKDFSGIIQHLDEK